MQSLEIWFTAQALEFRIKASGLRVSDVAGLVFAAFVGYGFTAFRTQCPLLLILPVVPILPTPLLTWHR